MTLLTPEKCHAMVADAIKAGRLQRPEVCEHCGSESDRIVAHHRDYSKPYEVEWLCRSCHAIEHARLRAIGQAPELASDRRILVGALVTPVVQNKLKALAALNGRSLSEELRLLLEARVKQFKDEITGIA